MGKRPGRVRFSKAGWGGGGKGAGGAQGRRASAPRHSHKGEEGKEEWVGWYAPHTNTKPWPNALLWRSAWAHTPKPHFAHAPSPSLGFQRYTTPNRSRSVVLAPATNNPLSPHNHPLTPSPPTTEQDAGLVSSSSHALLPPASSPPPPLPPPPPSSNPGLPPPLQPPPVSRPHHQQGQHKKTRGLGRTSCLPATRCPFH